MKFFERFKQLNRMSFFNKNLGKSQRYTAFTLAEVLITLGIIGVVAAMTIPSLIEKTQESEWHQAWKKEFSVVSQAYMQFKANNGGSLDEYFSRGTGNFFPDPFLEGFVSYLKTSQKCLITTDYATSICGTNYYVYNYIYKSLNGTNIAYPNFYYGNVILADGAQLFFRTYDGGHFNVWVDVNGAQKGPNTLGKDLYAVLMTGDKVMPFGAVGTNIANTCDKTAVMCDEGQTGCHGTDVSGGGCSALYLQK